MTQGLAVRNIYPETYPTVEPQLQLLPERESGYRTFFHNFRDLILRREEPPLFLASQPIHFRKHFYVRTGVHWMVVLESIVWHLAAVPLLLVFWTWSLSWETQHYAVARSHNIASQQDIYYPLLQAFPAREGRQHEEPSSPTNSHPEPTLHVAKEHRHESVETPDVEMNSSGAHSEIASSNPMLPSVPLAATSRSKLVLPGDLAEAIGPAPDGGQLALRGMSGQAATVVAPAPQISQAGRSGGIGMPAAVVAPSPALHASAGLHRIGGVDIGAATAIAPSPSLPLSQQRAGRGTGNGVLASSGVPVVPPAPSVVGRTYRPGGNGDLISGTGTQVVAPSPSMSHGLVLAGGHGNSLAGSGTQVVPPAPSVSGRAYLAGNGGSAIGGTGTNVVAPSPTLGNSLVSSTGRGHAFGGSTGTGVAAPAPSIAGSGIGNGRGGRGMQSFGDGTGSVVAPTPAIGMAVRGGTGNGGTGLTIGNGGQVVAPAPSLTGTGLGGDGTGLGGNGGKALVASLGTQAVAPPGMGSGGSGMGSLGSGNGMSGTGSSGTSGQVGRGGSGTGSAASGGGGETIAGLGAGPITGTGAGNGSGAAPIVSSAIPSHQELPDIPAGKTAVVPLRVIQLALALPMSSYFSNYEAFIAERSVNRSTQLIKLVYIFLPYQRRLTEFDVKPAKTFNLRVTRDPSCDESLLSMTWPEGEKRGQSNEEANKDKLPCYRTTADDYRRAWEKAR